MNIRQLHKKVSLVVLLPVLIVVLSGIILQLRNQFEWIQPKTVSGTTQAGTILTYDEVYARLGVSAEDVEQIIYRPKKKNISVRLAGGEEVQMDPVTGVVLKRAPRRTGFLIDIHQGSIFGSVGQYGIYILSSLGLLFLVLSGGYLLLPRRRKRHV